MSEQSIFLAALDIADPAQRLAYLNQVCGDDHQLRAHIDELIAAEGKLGGFLAQPHSAAEVTADLASATERPGTVIGPYKLREQIGEGGFGVVYVAEQERPVRRKVALKVIKPGMDTKDVVARFEAERQALAIMDHPNVARVLDAGATESGRPYFVMELVHGLPITEFCDKNKLATRERLLLFADTCRAVQHAHQKGIIHRDLKPSNVMVTLHDGKPVAKVIDFGVAKAISQQLTEKSIYTAYGQMIGTPTYMSPEQAEMSGLGIDTRSDIYSLGVLLYELLTGKTPLDLKLLRDRGYGEMLRMIREEEPPRPSMKISTLGDEAATIAHHRHTDPSQLRRSLRGELDWIVMKCLEKDRARRYETASGLARDVERFLQNEPVEACPPSATYRFRKTLGKHRVALTVATAFLGLLLSAVAVSTWQRGVAVDAAVSARRAQAAETQQRKLAEEQTMVAAKAERSAVQQRNNALAARESLQETLYAAEMNLVQAAVEDKQYSRASQLLEQQHPTSGQRDLRGFEWHYWHRQLHHRQLRSIEIPRLSGMETLIVSTNMLRVFSQDAKRLAAILGPGEGSSPRALVGVFDSVTGRELFVPFDPFPAQKHSQLLSLSLALSGDGTRLALKNLAASEESGERTTHISIHDSISGKELRRFEHPGSNIDQFLLSEDGSRLAVQFVPVGSVVRSDQTVAEGQAGIQVWNTSTGELVQTLPMIPWRFQFCKILWDPAGARLLRSSVSNDSEDNPSRLRQRFVLVDVASGKELWEREFSDLAYPLTPWSWSQDGKLIAVAEHEPPTKPKVQLWDGNAGTTLAVLDRDAPTKISPETLAFSPDGLRLATPSLAKEIYVWQLPKLHTADREQPLRIEKPDLVLPTAQEIVALTFGADSRELMGVDAGKSITTWNVTVDENVALGPDLPQGLIYAAFSPDASKVAFFAGSFGRPDNGYVLWDLERNSEIFRLDSQQAHRPDFTPDGRRIAFVRATMNYSGPITIHDTQTGAMLAEIPVEWIDASLPAFVIDQTFRPDGNHFAAILRIRNPAETKARLNVWEIATGQLLFSVVIDSEQPKGVNYSRDGASLIVGTTKPSEVVYYDATTGVQQPSVSMPPSSRPLFVDTQNQVIGASLGSDFILSDVTTGHELLRLSGFDRVQPNSYAISPDGSRLALGSSSRSGDGEITLWSMKSGRQLLSLHGDRPVDAMVFSPNGNRLIATFGTPSVRSGTSTSNPIQVFDATPLAEESVANR